MQRIHSLPVDGLHIAESTEPKTRRRLTGWLGRAGLDSFVLLAATLTLFLPLALYTNSLTVAVMGSALIAGWLAAWSP